MNRIRISLIAFALALSAVASAQEWVRPYESALRLAKSGVWDEARIQFLEAIKVRPEDTDKASQTGGSVADRRPWRGGSPYSPNFGAAYASFKLAANAADKDKRTAYLNDAIKGFQALIAKRQASMETMLFFAAALAANNQLKEASEMQEQIKTMDASKAFKIDRDIIEASDLAAIQGNMIPTGVSGGDPRAGGPQPGQLPTVGIGTPTGLVPPLDFKFALLIGVDGDHSANDVDLLKDSLVKNAGYPEGNVVVLKAPTAAEISAAASALADKMPDSGTAFIFYSGKGVSDPATGKDYLAGSDSGESVGSMVAKLSLYQPFISKGTSIFAFYQVDRSMDAEGGYFGREVPELGRVAQMEGTAPGEKAYTMIADGKPYGVYAHAMSDVLAQTRDNRITILDFVWNTFYQIRKGSVEGAGGGAQTPTLPVVVSMTTSAKF